MSKNFFLGFVKFVLSLSVFGSLIFAGLKTIELRNELKRSNREFVKIDISRNSLDKILNNKNFDLMPLKIFRIIKKNEREWKRNTGINFLKNEIALLGSYVDKKVTRAKTDQRVETILKDIESVYKELKERSLRSADDIKEIQRGLLSLKSSKNILFKAERVNSLKKQTTTIRKRFERSRLSSKVKDVIVGYLVRIESRLSLVSKSAVLVSRNQMIIERLKRKLNVLRSLHSDKLAFVESRQKNTHDLANLYFNLMTLVLTVTFIIGFRGKKIQTVVENKIIEREEVNIEEIKIKVREELRNEEPNFESVLKKSIASPTVILNSNDDIVWRSNSFDNLLDNSLKSDINYNWKDLLDSHLFVTTGAHHIKGAIKIKGKLKDDYKMDTRIVNYKDKEFRLIQVHKLYTTNEEVADSILKIQNFAKVSDLRLVEVGNTIEELTSSMSYLFQSSEIIVDLPMNRPMFVTFDEKKLHESMKTLLNGLALYLNSNNLRSKIEINYNRVKDYVLFEFSLHGVKVSNIENSLKFKGKTYPPLTAYLEKVERLSNDYKGEVSIKNIYDQENIIKKSLITLKVNEVKDTYVDVKALSRKKRISRAVDVAKNVLNQKEKNLVN